MFQICGLNESVSERHEEDAHQIFDREHLKQTNKEKWTCDINAIIVMSLTGFMWAYFNRFN